MPQTRTVSLGVLCSATVVATSVLWVMVWPGQKTARPQNAVAAAVV